MHHAASPSATLHLFVLKALARALRSGQFFVDRARRLCYTAAMLSVCRSKFACLACVLWLLWAAPLPAAQWTPLWSTDAQIFDAYRRSDPITKWPLKKTLHQIRELKGLEPAPDESQLPEILRRVSANLQKFVVDFVDTTSLETIKQTEMLPPDADRIYVGDGGVAAPTVPPVRRITQKFRYLMLARREGSAFTLVEHRTDLQGREEHPQKRAKNFIKTTGFASMPLFFGPLQQRWSDFRHLGQQTIGGTRTEVVAFAEHIEPTAVMGRFALGEASIPILLQGVAWIRSSDYQILKMRTDLLAPVPPVKRVTTLVLYARTQFEASPTTLWLPKGVEVKVGLGEYEFANRHTYSDYRLFRVKSVIRTDLPTAQQH